MSDLQNKANEIIRENIFNFLNRIHLVSETSPHKKIRRKKPGFALLYPGNEDFYQYAYYEERLEWFIRDELVNSTLKELFHLFETECLWPDTKRKMLKNKSNEWIEDVYSFQFIIPSKRIGYRYTSLIEQDEELEQRFYDYNINNVVVIDWSVEQNNKNYNHDDRVTVVSFTDFINEYFPGEVCSILLDSFRDAVKKANDDIGFQTIPRLSLRYLSDFKSELIDNISEKDFSKIRYCVLDSDNIQSQKYEKIALSDDDYDIINNNFKSKGLYKALLGINGFAKCFITAEYLFYIFKEGNSFDYTSVVSGYLKSVEQLVYEIVKMNLKNCTIKDGFWIKGNYPKSRKDSNIMSRKNPVTNKLQTLFIPENEKFFDITLSPMIWFLNDNNRYRVSANGSAAIHDLLIKYSQECRNDHFHKDNIDYYRDVECIRNNTYLVMYFLLGGCVMSGNIDSDVIILGVTDDSFDRLYKRLIEIPKSVRKFYVQFSTREVIAVIRLIDQDDVRYNEFGSVSDSVIKFVLEEKYTDIEDEVNMKADIVISKDNIPDKLWYVKYGGERVAIEW